MENTSFNGIVGEEGSASISGGCLAPMSLELKFRILEEVVLVEVEDKWFSRERGKLEGNRRISFERYLEFAKIMRELVTAPEVSPTFASSEMGAGVTLPMPKEVVEGGGHEMVEGPPPGPMISAIEKFAVEIFGPLKPVEAPPVPNKGNDSSEKALTGFLIAMRFLPFLLPLSIFILVFWWLAQQGASSLGDDCVTGGECPDHLCNITDTGTFWIFGVEGYCTKNCSTASDCPSHMRCSKTTFTQSSGTGVAHKYRQFQGYYCVPDRL